MLTRRRECRARNDRPEQHTEHCGDRKSESEGGSPKLENQRNYKEDAAQDGESWKGIQAKKNWKKRIAADQKTQDKEPQQYGDAAGAEYQARCNQMSHVLPSRRTGLCAFDPDPRGAEPEDEHHKGE